MATFFPYFHMDDSLQDIIKEKRVDVLILELLNILKNILLPVFIIMGIGFFIQKQFQLNLNTLSKLNIYILVPGFIFVKLYDTTFSMKIFSYVIFFFLLYVIVLYVLAKGAAKLQGFDHAKGSTFSNSILFFNSGNYGIPINDLVFKSDPLAMLVQVVVLTLQNIFIFTYGIFTLQAVKVGKWKAFTGYFKMPILYAMVIAIVLNAFDISVPEFIWTPANYIADAMIAMALVLLGGQVAQVNLRTGMASVYVSIFIRLVVGPVIALGLILLLQLEGTLAQALFIASSMPTAVNSSVIAQEYNNYPEFAAQIVLFSTIFSGATVTGTIYLSHVIF